MATMIDEMTAAEEAISFSSDPDGVVDWVESYSPTDEQIRELEEMSVIEASLLGRLLMFATTAVTLIKSNSSHTSGQFGEWLSLAQTLDFFHREEMNDIEEGLFNKVLNAVLTPRIDEMVKEFTSNSLRLLERVDDGDTITSNDPLMTAWNTQVQVLLSLASSQMSLPQATEVQRATDLVASAVERSRNQADTPDVLYPVEHAMA